MPAPKDDDLGIDKQRILKGVLQPEAATPSPAAETPKPAPVAPLAPPPQDRRKSILRYRNEAATMVLLMASVLWIVVAVSGKALVAFALGGFFLLAGFISLLLLIARR